VSAKRGHAILIGTFAASIDGLVGVALGCRYSWRWGVIAHNCFPSGAGED